MNYKKKKYYKGVSVGMFGLPDFTSEIRNVKSKKLRILSLYHPTFNFSFPKTSPKNLLVIYDIPEKQRKDRDWFRRHLKRFGYIMIQKSVWVGPSPLPREFVLYIQEIKLHDKFKTFRLAKAYEKKSP